MPVWRNWQTHRTQNAAEQSVPVRVRPPAPEFSALNFQSSGLFLLPCSLYSGVFRVKCENRICRRNLAAIIKVGVNIRCRSDVAMPQPLLNLFQADTVGIKKAGAAMPLRYNNDKRKKPLFSRGLSVCRHLFNSFSKLKCDEKIIEKRRLFH